MSTLPNPETMPPSQSIGSDAGLSSDPGMGWRGFLFIGLFWTFFGGVLAASLTLSELTQTGEATPAGLVAFSFFGAYAWAALTLPLFRLTRRLDLTGQPGSWRVFRVVGLLIFGLVFSALVSLTVAFATLSLLSDLFAGPLEGPRGLATMIRYRIPHDLLACLLVLTAGVARDYFLRYRSRLAETSLLRSQLAEARLQVLRTQLNPHFLFNTLNAVAALVQTDPRGVRRMIALLSDMLRETLDGASETEVPLERELEQVRRYLSIMEIRFRGHLEARIHTDPEVSTALVPHLILQPLVENAIKHGIGYGSELGVVEISATRAGRDLVLEVRDSGLGEPVDSLVAPVEGGVEDGGDDHQGGFGLRHTRERLSALYGERGGLELVSAPGGGTVARVRLVYHTDGPPLHPSGLDATEGDEALAAAAASR